MVETETGETYYLKTPSGIGAVDFFHYLIIAGQNARTLYKVFSDKDFSSSEIETLEELPWEAG